MKRLVSYCIVCALVLISAIGIVVSVKAAPPIGPVDTIPTTAPKPPETPTPTPVPLSPVSLKLDFCGGVATQTSITTGYDGVLTEPVAVPTKSVKWTMVNDWEPETVVVEYKFLGYFNNDVQYFDEDGNPVANWSYAADETLYAKWSDEVLTLNKIEKPGYEFKGWALDRMGSIVYVDGAVVKNPQEDKTLYSQYEERSYTVTLMDDDSIAGSVVTKYGEYLSKTVVPQHVFSVTFQECDVPSMTVSRQFAGYYSDAGVCYYDQSGTGIRPWDVNADTTLYARWVDTPITIEEPTKVGCDFKGWSLIVGGSLLAQIRDYVVLEDTVFYANWVKKPVDVFFDSSDIASLSAESGVIYPDVAPPTKEGYVFDGYYTEKDGEGDQIFNAEGEGLVECNKEPGETIRLYSKWLRQEVSAKLKYVIGLNETIELTSKSKFKKVKYNKNRVNITGEGTKSLEVQGKRVGSTKVKITKKNGDYDEVTVKVKKAPKSITVTPSKLNLVVGEYAKAKYSLGKDFASYSVTYSSSNKNVCSVSTAGQLKAKKKGSCLITVETFNGKTASIDVRVK